jgi:hypothetical protein
MSLDSAPLTRSHYAAFGSIIHSFAKAENLLQTTMAALTGTESSVVAVLTGGLGYRAKRDTLYSWMEVTKMSGASEIKSFFDAIDRYSYLRNHIAHSIWMAGTHPNSIKPISIRVYGGKGKLQGFPDDDQERDFTEQELTDEAIKLAYITNSYIQFLRDSGLWDRIDEKMRVSIEEITSSPGSQAK